LDEIQHVLPEYAQQSKGNKLVDEFVDKDHIIVDLPQAIQSYIQRYPR
jgi:hypothetical protein